MRVEVLVFLAGLAESACAQELSRRQGIYASNSTIPAVWNSTSSNGSYSSSLPASNSSSSSSIAAYTSPSSSPIPGPSSVSSIPPHSTPAYTSTQYHFNPTSVGPGTTSSAPRGSGSGWNGLPSTKANVTIANDHKPSACSGQTLNVLEASLDWWYTRTVYNVVSTFSITTNKNNSRVGWTLLPATTAFNLSSALASPTCTSSETFNSLYNQTLWDYSCFPAPTPVAASTTLLAQNAYAPPNATTGYGYPPDVIVTPAPAAITVPKSGGAYTEGTAFVFFSQYEIVTQTLETFKNGSSACATVTQTYDMEEAFSFEYVDGDVNGTKVVGAGVTGDVNPAFLRVVGASKAKAGSWVAAPTVAIVLQNIVAEQAVFSGLARPGFNPRLTTETVLQTPTATLPVFNTPTPSVTAPNKPPPPPPPPHIESTQTKLQVPTAPERTKNHPGQTTQNHPHPPKPTPPKPKPTTTTGKLGGFGHAISIIFSAIRPTTTTNALSVLQSALETFTQHTNPTVGAILHGVDGHKHDGAPSPTPAPLGLLPGGHKNGVGNDPSGRPIVAVGGTTFVGDSSTHFVLGDGQTLTPGGEVVMHGTTISLAPGLTAVVVNQHTFPAASMITPGPITVGGAVFAPIGGSTFDMDGQTLTPGGVITVDGTTISLASPATAVVINGHTSELGNAVMTAPAVLTVDGKTVTANQGGTFVINGQTLTPGGVIVVDGTTISLAPGATAVVVNGHTTMIAASATITGSPTLTIGSETFTPIHGGPTYDISGETLTPGEIETVTVDGTTYIVSLAPGATVLKIETEGPNGKVTATTYETLFAGGPPSTSTATEGSTPSAGPSASVTPATSGATLMKIQLSGICFAIGSFALAVWL